MVKIIMIKDATGSENGYDQPKDFAVDQEYDTTKSLAEAFVNQKKAIYLDDIEPAGDADTATQEDNSEEEKSLEPAGENKSLHPVTENKHKRR